MQSSDKIGFKSLFSQTADYYDGKMGSLDIWWNALEAFDFAAIRKAFSDHITDPNTGKFAPKASDIIGRIQANDGHPGTEQSWAQLKGFLGDETQTIILTHPQKAAFLAADAIADDPIAARMTFKEVYEHELRQWRASGKPIEFTHILGTDPYQRDEAVKQAVKDGKLLPTMATQLLAHKSEHVSFDQLLELAPPGVREQLATLPRSLGAR